MLIKAVNEQGEDVKIERASKSWERMAGGWPDTTRGDIAEGGEHASAGENQPSISFTSNFLTRHLFFAPTWQERSSGTSTCHHPLPISTLDGSSLSDYHILVLPARSVGISAPESRLQSLSTQTLSSLAQRKQEIDGWINSRGVVQAKTAWERCWPH
ncbi:hypothetical protein BDZ90DRAFT_75189 [Jaminaea rosea]|uniref:Uncharacterized protein n=1 Tax=Jaminaea rosea TaxID=1569628 RepID=A0A316UJH8_9BASI|nr:hypothetical protein BDZ90DRAFT_75189 [Jaminaea rosea]PWN25426.1 hypothetical protein BDZ90DRAFT_75189 [Jaminaea rosea]